jgi:carboxyl-terminal processing protease
VTRFRASKSSNNETRRFAPQTQSVSPVKIAFISTSATASASELVMNAFTPFLGVNAALVGSNSFGKPVGQIAVDQAACDDRIRVVAFAKDNSAGQGDYYSGLAGTMGTTCAAADDITRPLGDPQEASLRTARPWSLLRTHKAPRLRPHAGFCPCLKIPASPNVKCRGRSSAEYVGASAKKLSYSL